MSGDVIFELNRFCAPIRGIIRFSADMAPAGTIGTPKLWGFWIACLCVSVYGTKLHHCKGMISYLIPSKLIYYVMAIAIKAVWWPAYENVITYYDMCISSLFYNTMCVFRVTRARC